MDTQAWARDVATANDRLREVIGELEKEVYYGRIENQAMLGQLNLLEEEI
jgi:hypothetical protein